MSYLSNSLRLHFAGQFQATVSTVNNDVTHFNNVNFKSDFQKRQEGKHANGWWNPAGDGVWRLLSCAITSAFMSDGCAVSSDDPVLSLSIADSDDSAPAKIVDLDPQQQMVSTIFGLKVRIADADGNTLMLGNFDPAAFTELWSKVRSTSAGGDAAFGAMWQSVITVSEWGDVSSSTFLSKLKATSDANNNLLSIKFNVDLYSMNPPTPGEDGNNNFCRGRVVGTIGAATVDEPKRFVLGRQLFPQNNSTNVNFCAAVVDTEKNVIRLDLGNALPVQGDGSVSPVGDLSLQLNIAGVISTLGVLAQEDYTQATWYPNTAGIIEFPFKESALEDIESNPIQITLGDSSQPVQASERPNGTYLRADLFVFRLSDGQTNEVHFFATQFGRAYPNTPITFFDNHAQLQGAPATKNTQPGSLIKGAPFICAPIDGVTYPSSATTDTSGKACLTITGGDTVNFRDYIDGQIYGIGYELSENSHDSTHTNPWNFISVLVFDIFEADSPITWWGSMETIFKQYANLYPVMSRFIDLGDFSQVKPYAAMLKHAFSLAEDDPNAMPVTRDLSPAKRAAILKWLDDPLEGTPPNKTIKATSLTATAPDSDEDFRSKSQGGKSAAMTRRVCKQ